PMGSVTLGLTVDPSPPNLITDLNVEIGPGAGGGGEPAAVPTAALEPAVRTAVIDSVAKLLERLYPSADTGRIIGERLRQREREGAYARMATLADFASAVTQDMRSVNGDRHLNLGPPRQRRPGGGPGGPGGGGMVLEQRVLEGNVGYVRFGPLSAAPEEIARLAETFRALQSTGAMILDFRGAPGGSAEAANQIISHFTAPDLPSLHVVNRSEGTDFVRRTLARVPGPRRTDVPLYVLIDGRSGSAAEDVPFVLQNLGRATLVGERTAGAGRNNMIVPVGGGLSASISVSRVSDPRTGREWEAIGVQPDLAVPSADALEAARRAAVARMGRGGR
ncbi:MAG TPA: S41 family peptidase, partial [Longimicrobiaceae bacterium]|nr:S41 family peptidase [Longimicrobiaceae bacterium]